MRIARLGSMNQPIPAVEYGGTQRSMAQMTAFQAAITAHDITLYGPADSGIIAFTADIAEKLDLTYRVAENGESIAIHNADGRTGHVRLRHTGINATGYDDAHDAARNAELLDLFLADEWRAPFDLIHSHYRHFTTETLIPKNLGYKTLTHQHTGSLGPDYKQFRFPVICISESQAASFRRKDAPIAGVVHHGLDSFTHQPTTKHAGYLAWIGRFLPDKGADRAIAIAQLAGKPLIIAGTIYEKKPESAVHFESDVQPHIDIHDDTLLSRMAQMTPAQVRDEIEGLIIASGKADPVIFAGSANESEKQALYGNAQATLFPISWAEPFGRVMIESMACGTPVIGNVRLGAVDCGSVREVIADGVTGMHIDAEDIQESIRKSASAVCQTGLMDRSSIRAVFDRDWASERVARQLDGIYRAYLAGHAGLETVSTPSSEGNPTLKLARS